MRLIVVAVALLCSACGRGEAPGDVAAGADDPGGIPPGLWSVDYDKSSVAFAASQTGTPFKGEFERFDVKIVFDPAELESAAIDASIDMASARTGDRQRDAALPAGDWFNTKDFPTARFQSSRVLATGTATYVAHGQLTIRGVTRDVDLPFSLSIDGSTAHAVGEAQILRTDFGVGQGEFADATWVDLDVKVNVDIWASR